MVEVETLFFLSKTATTSTPTSTSSITTSTSKTTSDTTPPANVCIHGYSEILFIAGVTLAISSIFLAQRKYQY